MLSNKVYNILKWLTMVGLPAVSTLYFALSAIWGLPYAEQVVGTTAAVTTFLGILLGISNSQYKKSDGYIADMADALTERGATIVESDSQLKPTV